MGLSSKLSGRTMWFFPHRRGKLVLVSASLFLTIEVVSLLIWLGSEGYFDSSREERCFRDARWQLLKVNQSDPSALEGEEFIPNKSFWTVPSFSNGNKFKAGLERTSKSALFFDHRIQCEFRIVGGVLQCDLGEFRILKIDRHEMTLGVIKDGILTADSLEFRSTPLPEDLRTPWYFYLFHLAFQMIWAVPLIGVISGQYFGKRVTGSRKRAWWITAIATSVVFTLFGTTVSTIITFINNRHTVGGHAEIYGPPIFLFLFAVLSLPFAILNASVRSSRMKREAGND